MSNDKHFYRFHCQDAACGEPMTVSGKYFLTSASVGDAMRAGESNCTTDWDDVTCPKCKEWREKVAAYNQKVQALDSAQTN